MTPRRLDTVKTILGAALAALAVVALLFSLIAYLFLMGW